MVIFHGYVSHNQMVIIVDQMLIKKKNASGIAGKLGFEAAKTVAHPGWGGPKGSCGGEDEWKDAWRPSGAYIHLTWNIMEPTWSTWYGPSWVHCHDVNVWKIWGWWDQESGWIVGDYPKNSLFLGFICRAEGKGLWDLYCEGDQLTREAPLNSLRQNTCASFLG